MATPPMDFTCRIALEFVLAMEKNTLCDDLWDELPPETVLWPSDGTNGSLILQYAAFKLQEYQPRQHGAQYESRSFNVFPADSLDNAKESEWTLLQGPDLPDLDRAECEALIHHGTNGLQNCGSRAWNPSTMQPQ